MRQLRFSLLLTLFSVNSYAAITQANDAGFLYWPSRVSVEPSGGTITMAKGDGMFPLYGDNANSLFFNTQAKYANDSNWGGAVGLGYRHIYNEARILGAYVFADGSFYSNENNLGSETFWFLNPGIESLGNLLDMRVNGYIPVTSQETNVGSYSATTFAGHSQYNTLFETINSTGPGIDGEVGIVKIPLLRNLRAYVGGYHFQPKNQDEITGISGRLEYPLNHYVALTAVDTYDNNEDNTFQIGIRFTLGGQKDDINGRTIERRIVDPINRNLATQYTGTDVPVIATQTVTTSSSTSTPNSTIVDTGIYFFTGNGGTTFDPNQGSNNCTAEKPCSSSSFSQTTVNDIADFTPNAKLYFNIGAYSLGSLLALPDGQSLYGRTLDYTEPATGNQRAQFNGGISLGGNNRLDSIIILNQSLIQPIAVNIDGVNDIVIRNTSIESEVVDPTVFTTVIALNLNSANNVNITNSQIITKATSSTSPTGIEVFNIKASNSQFRLANSTLTQNLMSDAATNIGGPIKITNATQADITNSQITSNNTSNAPFASVNVYGIDVSGGSTVNITDSKINVSINSSRNAFSDGIANFNSTVNINNSVITAESNSVGSDPIADSVGAFVSSGVTTINNSVINVTSNSKGTLQNVSTGRGLVSASSGVMNASNTTLNVSTNTSGTTTGNSQAIGAQATPNGGVYNPSNITYNLSATGLTPTSTITVQ